MLVTGILVVGLVALIGFVVKKYYEFNNNFWETQGVPTINLNEVANWYKRFTMQISLADLDQGVYDKFGDVKYGGYLEMGTPVFYVKDLDVLKSILVKDFDHFVDRRIFPLSDSDKSFGRMLSNLTGKEWKDLRSAMSPTFTTGRIRRMFQLFNACGYDMVKYIREEVKTNDGVLDIQNCMGSYTLSAIASIAFGLQIDTFTSGESLFMKMAKQIQKFSAFRVMKLLFLFFLPKVANYFEVKFMDIESTTFFENVITSTIKHRREEKDDKEKRQDFLQLMLEAQAGKLKLDEKELDAFEKDGLLRDEGNKNNDGTVLDDETILAQSLLFFVAGSETLESALTFVSYALALNPEVQEKLALEVTQIMEESGGNLTYDLTQQMKYLDMVLSESLRLYPPSAFTERECTHDYTVPGTNIVLPKGSRVNIPINGIHHDKKHYDDPFKFNPENFSPENKAKRHPYTFITFGQGPRNCIAMRFAMTEAKAAIAHLVYNFKIGPCDKTQIPMKYATDAAILKPVNGLWLKFSARETNADGFVKL